MIVSLMALALACLNGSLFSDMSLNYARRTRDSPCGRRLDEVDGDGARERVAVLGERSL
jgi:hypothetical protein